MSNAKKARHGAGRLGRTLRSLAYITALGVVLAVYNAVALHRDVGLAIGPAGTAQEQFFRGAADRPDIAIFFKNLRPDRRLSMAKNIGRYSDPELAKLCGKCLGTFDPAARAALTDSLAVVAKAHPDAAAALMTLPGSFQQLAIASALRQAGAVALPLVAKEFSEADARANAIAYLVASGTPAIAPTMPYLDSTDEDVRLAAADALGKLRARQAVPKLTHLYDTSSGEERLGYLTALADIGAPQSEGLMQTALNDESLSTPVRAQAALGLGAIGTRSALTTLWGYAGVADQNLRASAISALQLAGDAALNLGVKHKESLLQVAGGVHSRLADDIIRRELADPSETTIAAHVAGNRPDLAPALVQVAERLDSASRGDVVDALLRALATTPTGRSALKEMAAKSTTTSLGALAERRLSLTHPQG